MAILLLNLFLVFLLMTFVRINATSYQIADTSITFQPNKLFLYVAIFMLVLVSGLRANIGDTFYYMHAYNIQDFTWEYIFSEKDFGFGILQMLLKNYISEDPQILIFTTALLTNVFIVLPLFKYSKMVELSLYVYITGGLFLVTMNAIRQTLAAAIAFAATKYLIEGDWKKYFAVILIASTFHQTALLLIPVYFIVQLPAWSKMTVFLIGGAVAVVFGFDLFTSALFYVIENTQYANYENFQEGGANVLRVLVESAPLLIAYFGRHRLKELMPNSDIFVNMTIIGFLFLIISTQNWIFARFAIYFTPFQLV